jgi:hypothetical protein
LNSRGGLLLLISLKYSDFKIGLLNSIGCFIQSSEQCLPDIDNPVPRAFCFRGWIVSEKGPGFSWSIFQPDWSLILNASIQEYNYVGTIISLAERECSDKFIINSEGTKILSKLDF